MKAVIYARISSEDQSNYSLEQQVKECRDLIDREGHVFVDTYIDDGYSAKDMNRPALQSMIDDISTKKFDMVVIWKLDRLTRDTLDGLVMVKTHFKPNGIEFVSKTEDIDTTTPDGFMMFTIRLSMAQAEREKIRERSTMGQEARARSGKRNTSTAPYGYNVVEDLKLTVNQEEAEIVKQIFGWFLEGHGKRKIGNILNERSVPCPKGGKLWAECTVDGVITNPTYYGAVHWKRKGVQDSERIVVEGVHEAIIPKDVWLKAQDYYNRRREHWMSQSSYEFPFSTVVKCGLCGRSFHGKYKSRGKLLNEKYEPTRHYRCSGKYRADKCDSSDVSETKLTDVIFRDIQFEFEEFNPNETVTKEMPDHAKERKRLMKELEKSKERLVKLAKAMSSGNIDFDIYTQLREEEKKKEASFEKQIASLPSTDETVSTKRLGEIAAEIRDMKESWNDWSLAKRKQRIQQIFKKIVVAKVNGNWQVEEFEINA